MLRVHKYLATSSKPFATVTLLFLAGVSGARFASAGEGIAIRSMTMANLHYRADVIAPVYRSIDGRQVVPPNRRGFKPLSLAIADFNSDGYPDVVVGYATPNGGALVVHFADPEAFAPKSPKSLSGIRAGRFPQPFLDTALLIPTDSAPELCITGDFNQDGYPDIAFASKGGNRFYVLYGDGKGGFSAPRGGSVSGAVEALAARPLGGIFPGADILVGVSAVQGSAVLEYGKNVDGPPAATYRMMGPVAGIAVGDLDGDPYPDVAIVAAGNLYVLHGGETVSTGHQERLERVALSFSVAEVALGHYVPDRLRRTEMAVLAEDGQVGILARGQPGGQIAGAGQSAIRSRRRTGASVAISEPWRPGDSEPWVLTGVVLVTDGRSTAGRLFTAHLSESPTDDLLLADPQTAQVSVLNSTVPSGRPDSTPHNLSPVAALGMQSQVVAMLPVRLSVMGAPGLVALQENDTRLHALTQQPGVTYHVTGLGDSQSGSCSAPSGSPVASSCTTLRAAVIGGNANPGQDLIVFDLNGTITLTVPGDDDNAMVGDLDVTDALTIVGNGTANTIIQGGPTAATGIDKVFSFNPLGWQPGFPVSISGMTIQNGLNPDTDPAVGNNEGGAFDFDAGLQDGAGSLSVSNCAILQNSTINGDGGGVALFDGGPITITNTTISGNTARSLLQATPFYASFGGGLLIANPFPFSTNVSIVNTTISNNNATTTGEVPPSQLGGGIYSFAAGAAIHGSTVSGNAAASDGGGLYGAFTIDQTSVISGNASGGHGGGVFGTAAIMGSTLTINSAATGGGGIYANGATTVTGSRLVGNTSASGALAVDSSGSTVTATNNWWGSNSAPTSAVNTSLTTFTPWLLMTLNATPGTVNVGGTTTLAASINTGSNGSSGFAAPDGTPVTFSGSLGTMTPSAATTTSGVANSTYTAGSSVGTASVTSTIDGQTLSASVGIVAPPTLTSLSPASGVQGTSVPVTLTGTNFVSGATVSASNPGITVASGSVNVVSATQITATLTIAANAALGPANVTVTTGGGTSGAAAFTVNPPAPPSTVQVTVGPNISGPALTVDSGTAFTGSQTFAWAIGSNHTIAAATPQPGIAGTQYVWLNWSDGQPISHSVIAPATATAFTANFKTQYLVTTAVLPSASEGTVSPANGYVDAGTIVAVSAAANTGYVFTGFSGALTGTTAPQNLTASGPSTVTANFAPGPTGMGALIGLQTGPLNARVWPITIGNGGPGVALGAEVTSLTFVQQAIGAPCITAPVITSPMPAVAGDILAAKGTATAYVTIDFSGCPSNAFFKVTATLSANGGAAVGTITRANEQP